VANATVRKELALAAQLRADTTCRPLAATAAVIGKDATALGVPANAYSIDKVPDPTASCTTVHLDMEGYTKIVVRGPVR